MSKTLYMTTNFWWTRFTITDEEGSVFLEAKRKTWGYRFDLLGADGTMRYKIRGKPKWTKLRLELENNVGALSLGSGGKRRRVIVFNDPDFKTYHFERQRRGVYSITCHEVVCARIKRDRGWFSPKWTVELSEYIDSEFVIAMFLAYQLVRVQGRHTSG